MFSKHNRWKWSSDNSGRRYCSLELSALFITFWSIFNDLFCITKGFFAKEHLKVTSALFRIHG